MHPRSAQPAGRHLRLVAALGCLCSLAMLGLARVGGARPIAQRDLPTHYVAAIAVDDRAGVLFVADAEQDRVLMLDGETGRLLRSFRTGQGPAALTLDPMRGRLMVANQDDDTLSAIDYRGRGLVSSTSMALASYPEASLAIDAPIVDIHRQRLYLTGGAGRAAMLDMRSARPLRRSAALPASDTVLGGPLLWDGGRHLYLLQPGSPGVPGTITVLDRDTLRVLASLHVGADAQGMALDPLHHRLFVTGSASLITIDLPSGRIIRRTPGLGTSMPPAVDSMDARLFLVAQDGQHLRTLDSGSDAVLSTLALPYVSGPLVLDPPRHRLLVPTAGGLAIVDARGGSLLQTLDAPATRLAAVDPVHGRLFLLSDGGPARDPLGWLPAVIRRHLPGSTPRQLPARITIFAGPR